MFRIRYFATVAVFVAFALFVRSCIRRICSVASGEKSASKPVPITPHQETDLTEIAQVLGSAFATEAFTTTALGRSIRQVEDVYELVIELLLRAHLEAAQPVFTVTTDEGVIGVAALSRPGVSWAPFDS